MSTAPYFSKLDGWGKSCAIAARYSSISRPSQAPETATFLPDCDGQPSRCKAYGNYARFRGFPFIPADNPTLPDSSVDMDYSKK